jgi:predicted transposase YbfD/YdcC
LTAATAALKHATTVCSDIGWLQDLHAWPGLAAIGRVTRTREAGAKTTTEAACYLLSVPLSAKRLGEVARAHWGVENGLHWVLDVTMNEDRARTRKDHSPQNNALLRRLALNLAKLEPSRGSMKGKLKRAGWDDTFLTSLLAQFSKTQMR